MVLDRVWAGLLGPWPRGPAGRPERDGRCRLTVERLEGRENPDTTPAAMLDPNLQVTTVVGAGLSQPIGIVFLGNQGRRGWLQHLPNGPFLTAPQVDDTFGGPAPDNAHLTGVILRLNDDGSAPTDNPFFAAGAAIGGEVGANIQKVYSYGHRNGFGMVSDPYSGFLWDSENADDAYSELNRVIAGMDGGRVQLACPRSGIGGWKQIE